MKKIKVAFVASTFTVGGSETVMREVILRLPRDRFAVRLFFLKSPGIIGDLLLQNGVEGESRLQRGRFDCAALWRLAGRLKRFNPDILFSLDHRNAMLWGRLASLLARVPFRVVASHSTGLFGGKRSFTRLDRALMGATDAVVALSETHARYLADCEGIPRHKIRVIENGVDVERFAPVDRSTAAVLREKLGIPSGHKVVLMAAALRPEKAHEALLESARILAPSISNIRFVVAGAGPRENHLRALAERLGVSAQVQFLGRRSDIPELLNMSDVLVLPSHAVVETLPLVVLEAMASGVPVIASAVGSIPEIVRDGETGRLIPPADPERLADALVWIFDHDSEARAMAERGRTLVAGRYTAARMVDGYVKLFESLVGKNIKENLKSNL